MRKRKFLREFKQCLLVTVLDKQTYYVYYSLRSDLSARYALEMIHRSIYDLVKNCYKEAGFADAFYSEDMPKVIDSLVNGLLLSGEYVPCTGRKKYVFIREHGIEARRIFFQVGDHAAVPLTRYPATRMELSNIMFDVIGLKGQPDIDPCIFADEDRMVNMFTLKYDEEGE